MVFMKLSLWQMGGIFLVVVIFTVLMGCAKQVIASKKQEEGSSSEVYNNPIDKKSYVVPGGWKHYKSNVPQPDESGKKVKMGSVRLLTSQEEIAARTTVDELANFIKEVAQIGEKSLGKSDKMFQIMAQFDCTPEGHEVKIAHQGDAPEEELLQQYYDALKAMKKLPIKQDKVVFQVEFSVNPKAK
jgi:hypothetical protein